MRGTKDKSAVVRGATGRDNANLTVTSEALRRFERWGGRPVPWAFVHGNVCINVTMSPDAALALPCIIGRMPEHHIAIDNVCGWPNLTPLPDGTILATIFNQPVHGRWQGDVECWASEDGGRRWAYRGTPAPHEPGTNRMNVAAGLTVSGQFLVIASGWSDRPEPGGEPASFSRSQCLKAWVCRSADGGRSWTIDRDAFPDPPTPERTPLIPFGDILAGDDGKLGVCAYAPRLDGSDTRSDAAYFLHSDDEGRSWHPPFVLAEADHNETAPLHLGAGRWLAAARTGGDQHLDLLRSEDNGRNWRLDQPLSLPDQIPAHLLRTHDGGGGGS